MPPKRAPKEESSDSDSGPTMMGGGPGAADPSRFFNVNFHREFMAKLPETIRNRTKLLLSIDAEVEKITNDNDAKRFAVMKKYYDMSLPLMQRRREIIVGEKDVTEEEVKIGFPAEHEGVVKLTEEGATSKADGDVVGLPNFWLDALKHHVIVNDMITERDEEVLSLVQDVQFVPLENGFTLLFVFPADNEFFTESQITKTVLTKKVFGEEAFDTTIESPISWRDGKDVTVETITKKQTNKAKKGAVRYVSKTEPCDSFFNMFKHHDDPEEMEQYCSMAHAIGKLSRYAVDCVTGIAPDGSSDVEDDEDDEMYGDDEEEDEEDSEDEAPAPKRGGAKGGRGGSSSAGAGAGEKECKQQ
jgi:nucleosome assembly protein 1-like 1